MTEFKHHYQIFDTDGNVIATLTALTPDDFNNPIFLKRIVDVLETRYLKLKDKLDGLDIQIKLEDRKDG